MMDNCRLEEETRYMLAKARQAAAMQVQLERQARQTSRRSYVEEIVGVRTSVHWAQIGVQLNRKLSRLQLSKMGVTQLQLITNDLHSKIERRRPLDHT